jgi:hypothetical protein
LFPQSQKTSQLCFVNTGITDPLIAESLGWHLPCTMYGKLETQKLIWRWLWPQGACCSEQGPNGSWPGFVNKTLLKHSHTYLWLWLLSPIVGELSDCDRNYVASKPKMFIVCPLT